MTVNQQLCGGVARATVTPPVGIDMEGFGGRGPATGVHDDLYVTAIALQAGETKAALVAADLIGFPADRTAAIREEVDRRTGIPGQCVALCASHTHYGPRVCMYDGQAPADVAAYREVLVHLAAGAIQEAAEHMTPVRVGVARGVCDIGINRREKRPDGVIVLGKNPRGPIDRELIVVRIDTTDGEPLAALVNFATHGVCQGGKTRTISADFVAPMRDLVEQVAGVRTLYLQGGCGNINPRIMEASFEPARRLGLKLGAAVLCAYEEADPQDASGLAATSSVVGFPAKTFASEDKAREAVEKISAELDRFRARGGARDSVESTERRLRRAKDALESLRTGTPLPPVEAEVMSLRFGDVAIAMGPGEIFNQIGMEVKRRSPIADTLFVSYANCYDMGYVPVPEAYPEGGYEVERASKVGPESAGMLTREALRQLAALDAR